MSAIKKMIEDGQTEQATLALADLLEMGPNNMEALKLKATLLETEGRFQEEEKVWRRIASVDEEDEDAQSFLQRKHIEDRENYYFTEDLPDGARRFLAYPRSLITISMFGLCGCFVFLMTTRLAENYPLLKQPTVILLIFALTVFSPWLAIIHQYFLTVRAVTVGQNGIVLSTRVKAHAFLWTDLKQVVLAHTPDPASPDLRLVLVPHAEHQRPVELDLNYETTAIRARSHLVQEIHQLHGQLEYASYADLKLAAKRILRF